MQIEIRSSGKADRFADETDYCPHCDNQFGTSKLAKAADGTVVHKTTCYAEYSDARGLTRKF